MNGPRWATIIGAVVVWCWSGQADAGMFSTHYRTNVYVDGFIETNNPNPRSAHASPGRKYEILGSRNAYYQIRFLDKSKKIDGIDDVAEVKKGGIYLIPQDTLKADELKRSITQSFEVGVLAVPFKVRGEVAGVPMQVTGGGPLGAAFAWRMATDLVSTRLAPLIFVGLSQVALKQDEGEAAKESSALTLATGLQIEVKGRARLGLVAGWDWAGGSEGRDWAYQGRPWYSVALNFSFFTGEIGE